METKFREISELMDDASDKMPEGTYLALYGKLKELRDESNKNTEVDSDDDNYYEPGGLWFANNKWRLWEGRYNWLESECRRRGNESSWRMGVYRDKIKEQEDKIKELEKAARVGRWMVGQCRCGSTTHLKTNALGCRLNKRVLRGELGNVARDRALAETAALADPPTEV